MPSFHPHTKYLFIANGYFMTQDELADHLDNLGVWGFNVTMIERDCGEGRTRPQIEIRFSDSDAGNSEAYVDIKKFCQNRPTNVDAGLFEETHDLMAEFQLKNWLRVA